MRYRDWVLAIFDEVEKRFEQKKKEERFEQKEKNQEDKSENKRSIKMIGGLLIGCALYLYGIFIGSEQTIALGYLLIIFSPILYLYTEKKDLKYYKCKLDILEKVLNSENLNNEKAIKELIKETSSLFLK